MVIILKPVHGRKYLTPRGALAHWELGYEFQVIGDTITPIVTKRTIYQVVPKDAEIYIQWLECYEPVKV